MTAASDADDAGDETVDEAAESVELEGVLRWNDVEGGFWSLELEPEHPQLGSRAVLSGFELPEAAVDGARVRVCGVPRPDLVDFLMAGTRLEVSSATTLD